MTEKIPIKEDLFVESTEGAVLLGNRCKSCGQVFFPAVPFCFSCFNEDMEAKKLSRKGKLLSYTVGHMPSTHFQPPYALGYVDMPEEILIYAPLIIDESKPFKVGMEMEVDIETLWQEGEKEVIGYKFKPV